ncbi:hypothetical protein CC77DRAFT_1023804 [Alternaria alternata]|uniref:Uncharacterized protein n=2 Tax=Alternaria alternata complex TaxID=187734 RepID=A0A177DBB6_ALTAL|nr:hypothetical protein CC77DRAFT_1023804 [Alternaria alternata]RYN37361.1 hypothetical protein AA0115_g1151 [Alternaria tenuissima]KAH6840282.1 hypothetical protein B0T12DRAFT_363571 [Alternaria alternata]OAG16440.1 hypothetical protein CC77DRAFT_1023804 [Alternaria alternata]OWY56461.1 ubiquitin carboxyl-terminal hydrolase 14 [Alternaria alternata]RYN49780.1 hypothetical protein AA0114_g6385 [Alternaria tenuissima]
MSTVQQDEAPPAIRFKRRKIAHPKRVFAEDDAPTVSASHLPDAATLDDAQPPPKETNDEEESVPNLKEILRNRKRPRDRLKETVRKVEPSRTDSVQVEAPRPDQYTSRFVAQTGQVVDRDDRQMSEYVEARMAEKNYRQYGWPIPSHLQASVVAIAPDLQHTFASSAAAHGTSASTGSPADNEHSNRLAAGQGKLEEVDLGPEAAARTEQAWKRWDKGEPEPPASKARRDKYGYAWRKPKANGKTDEDKRRDQMVEAVLREAKLDFFDSTTPTNPHVNPSVNTDDALVEQFRSEYYESMQARQQARKPAAPTVKGAPPPITGPKLGGSKSARAKMHKLQQEELAKKKR